MAELILFHHALGLTPGVLGFADDLRAAGHRVTVPDLYDGATFPTLEAGVAHAEKIGFGEVIARGEAAAAGLPADVVYAGFSLGVLPAQKLAQTRPGARAAVLYYDALPASEFGDVWPEGVALQVHIKPEDEWSDAAGASALVDSVAGAELFTYPGTAHLFVDSGTEDYEPDNAELVLERTLALLARWP